MRKCWTVGLPAVAMVALTCGQASAAAPTGTTQIREVVIFDRPSPPPPCDHDVVPDHVPTTLHKGNPDKLHWKIENNCKADQPVLFCVYLDGQRNNPFAPCGGSPGADIEQKFTVKAGKQGNLVCHPGSNAQLFKKYVEHVLVDTDIPKDGCPQEWPQQITSKSHTLDIEILP
jgi:hypothetical protein